MKIDLNSCNRVLKIKADFWPPEFLNSLDSKSDDLHVHLYMPDFKVKQVQTVLLFFLKPYHRPFKHPKVK